VSEYYQPIDQGDIRKLQSMLKDRTSDKMNKYYKTTAIGKQYGNVRKNDDDIKPALVIASK
jgi:hypothetical protein